MLHRKFMASQYVNEGQTPPACAHSIPTIWRHNFQRLALTHGLRLALLSPVAALFSSDC